MCSMDVDTGVNRKARLRRPGKPQANVNSFTHDVSVRWAPPEDGAEGITRYAVSYKRNDDHSSEWMTQKTPRNICFKTLKGLESNAVYIFKVHAERGADISQDSEMSEPLQTTPATLSGPPGKPEATTVTHNTVHLTWAEPESGAESVRYYTVSYCPRDGLPQWITSRTEGPKGVAVISGLTAECTYSFKVQAECEDGVSQDSEASEPIQTKPLPISSQPGKPKATKVTHNTIHLTWSQPGLGAESIKYYLVSYRPMVSEAEWMTQTTKGDAVISGLIAKSIYCFKVHAVCEAGVSQDSEMSEPIQTNPPPLPGRPGTPEATKVTHNTVHLTWSDPKSGAERVQCYTVSYRPMVSEAQWMIHKTQAAKGNAVISGLTAKSVYSFKVHAVCEDGVSQDSETSEPIQTNSPPISSRPGKPEASKVTHNTVHLTWFDPESGAESVQCYTVSYRPMVPSAQWMTHTTQTTKGNAVINGLIPNTVYCFKVHAECEDGVSQGSEMSEPIQTNSPPLPGRPGTPKASKVTHNTVHLTWPDPESGTETVQCYTVSYRPKASSTQWMTHTTQTAKGNAVISGLIPNTAYNFKVHAECEDGVSQDSETSEPIQTNLPPISSRPGTPEASKVTHNTIHLTWSDPESDAESVKCYTVSYRPMVPSAQWMTDTTQTAKGNAVISGLTPNTVYCFKVHAECEAGVSQDSEMSEPIQTNPPPLPGRPGTPEATKVTHNTVHLTWPDPESGAESVQCYTISYRAKSSSAQWMTHTTQTAKGNAVISGLTANTVYSFKVHAECEDGVSQDSETSEPIQTNSPPISGRPGTPEASKVTHNTIHLTWSDPESNAESVKRYTVSYRPMVPSAQWMTHTTQTAKGNAVISGLTPQTVYCFKVHAVCEAGVSQDSEMSEPIQTNPPPLPGRPGTPEASKVTHNTVHLTWSDPESGAESIKSYTVSYRQMIPSARWMTHSTQTTKNDAVISGLTANSLYCFKVHAECEAGVSQDSEMSEPIQTNSPPISGQPGTPKASKVTHNTIHLTWSDPKSGAERVQCYTVSYRPKSSSSQWMTHTTQTAKGNAVISGLIPNMVYSFKVHAECEDGVSQDSKTSEPIQTNPPPISSRPGKPEASKVTHNTVHLTWSDPESGTEGIKCYTVSYRQMVTSAKWMTHKMQTAKGNAVINGLIANSLYCFKVHAECEAGVSQDSEMSEPIPTNPPPLPGRPGAPKATKVTHNTVHLTWSDPESGAESVQCYTVSYRPMVPSAQWMTHTTQTAKGNAVISDLTANTAYSFKVQAECKAGVSQQSEMSAPIQTRPLPISGPPGKPQVTNVTHNTIHLTWSQPKSGAGSVRYYSVSYCTMEHSAQWTTLMLQATKGGTVINGLTANSVYYFKVHAVCKAGVSQDSEVSEPIQTSPPPVSGRPGKPQATNMTHNLIHLTWSHPDSGAESVKCYIVSYRPMIPSALWMTHSTQTTKNDAVISGLTAKSVYCFKVHAECEAGVSQDSEMSEPIQTNPPPLPGRPGTPEATKVTHNTVCLTWSDPKSGAESIQCYTVSYRPKASSSQWMTHTTQTAKGNAVISGLTVNTAYSFKVHAECEDGVSQESETSAPIQTRPPPISGPPGKPQVTNVTHNTVHLTWSNPESGAQSVRYYIVSYRSMASAQWMTHKTQSAKGDADISGLDANTVYFFKVQAECEAGRSPESENFAQTNSPPPPGQPGKPEAYSVTHDTIQLTWSGPERGAQYVKHYMVHYCRENGRKWEIKNTQDHQKILMITGLVSKTRYRFKVQAQNLAGKSTISEECIIETKPKDRLAEEMLKSSNSEVIEKGPPVIYKLKTREVERNEAEQISIRAIGKPPHYGRVAEEKVLMILGATGAGKTTLINGIANYLLGVELEDDFRFKLIAESTSDNSKNGEPNQAHSQTKSKKGEPNQAHSQTQWITAYTFYKKGSSRIPYTLTIIDTPGFGDTGGLQRDEYITSQIKAFFTMKHPKGIDHLDGIGFVTQAAMPRLTPTQKYVFHSILSTFGKDIGENIFMLITFADGAEPPVLSAISEAQIPHCSHFEFNNSALYSKGQGHFIEMFWRMGYTSFDNFFDHFKQVETKSLQLTREVLQERHHLEAVMQGILPQINQMMCKMNELQQDEEAMKRHEGDIEDNRNFEYKVTVVKHEKVKLEQGEHDTICITCNYTCHYPCYIEKDDEKYYCAAMTNHRPKDATCGVCPGKCSWEKHFNLPYRIVGKEEEETRTYEGLKQRFEGAIDDKSKLESVISEIKQELEAVETDLYIMISKAQEILKKLDDIALRRSPLTQVQYIDLLIESEKQDLKRGWEQRVEHLQKARKKAEVLSQLQDVKPEDKPEWVKRMEERKNEIDSGKGVQSSRKGCTIS